MSHCGLGCPARVTAAEGSAQGLRVLRKKFTMTDRSTMADPHDKAEVFRQLGLKLTYHPGRRLVEAIEWAIPPGQVR